MTNEVEADTIGDWAGHTPEGNQEAPQPAETYSFTLQQRGSSTVTERLLGLFPYVLVVPELCGDEEAIHVHIEVGGGAELEGIDELFTSLGALLGQPDAIQQIREATEAAKLAANEDEHNGE